MKKILLIAFCLGLFLPDGMAQEKSPFILKASTIYRHYPMFVGNAPTLRAIPFQIIPDDQIGGLGLGLTIGIYAEKIRTAVEYRHSIHNGTTHWESFYLDTSSISPSVSVPINKLIHDLELDVVKYFGKGKIVYFASIGGTVMNLNTHYFVQELTYTENCTHNDPNMINVISSTCDGAHITYGDTGNLILGGAKLGFGAEYKRLSAELSLFFCEQSVYQNRNPFLFPELRLSYSFL
ncbi:MAG: hypothetical protein HN686_06020 [Bacteroidetes bacterium]|jgi:hypothetical protein|nr:hypothetical protein [Bacteroidota bacterium]MBT7463517.1 hypothetical protein [Bacteroidota bacterium]